MSYIVAIDGPAGSGKSTISKILSEKYNLLFISSGKYYRALTYLFNKNNFKEINEEFIQQASNAKIDINDNKIFLNNNDITSKITDELVSNNISLISSHEQIREIVNEKIRDVSKKHDIVMDGRDIGTVVFPNANLKIYLTASSWQRAKRRKKELIAMDKNVGLFSIWKSIVNRDYKDKHRKIAPLKKASDAIVISSTKFTINEVIDKISKYIKR